MPSQKTAFAVGLFTIVGLAIAIVAIVWLGMSNYFQKAHEYVSYFDESVQGLDKDSAVKYRGVAIGRVNRVNVAPDGTLIEVVLSIDIATQINPEKIVAKLKSVGITGIMFIELDVRHEGESDLSPKINFKPQYQVIATKPSDIKQFMEGVDLVLAHVRNFDSKGISDRFKTTMDNINQAVEDAQIRKLSSDIRETLSRIETVLDSEKWKHIIASLERSGKSLEHLMQNADRTVADVRTDITSMSKAANQTIIGVNQLLADTSGDIREAIGSLKNSSKQVEGFLAEGTGWFKNSDLRLASIQRHLLTTLQHLEKASEGLNTFVEVISDRPSRLVFGQPVSESKSDAELQER